MIGAILAAILLPTYGNAFSLIHEHLRGRRRIVFAWAAPLALLGTVTALKRNSPAGPDSFKPVATPSLRQSTTLGAAAGVALALPAIVWFHWPGRRPVLTDELRLPVSALLLRVFIITPLLVALPEEMAFRAFLQGRLMHGLPQHPGWAVSFSSLSFAAWHITVNLHTLRRTNVLRAGIASLPLALAGGLIAVFAAGLAFGGLYRCTRTLLAPVLAHWLADALIVCALYEWRPSARDLRRRRLEETTEHARRRDRPNGV